MQVFVLVHKPCSCFMVLLVWRKPQDCFLPRTGELLELVQVRSASNATASPHHVVLTGILHLVPP